MNTSKRFTFHLLLKGHEGFSKSMVWPDKDSAYRILVEDLFLQGFINDVDDVKVLRINETIV